jgi:hypothetical protein
MSSDRSAGAPRGSGTALARPTALVWTGPTPVAPGVADAEARLRAVLARVTDEDLAVEALSGALADFGRRWERELGDAFAALVEAERLVRRLQGLEEGLLALAERLRAGEPAVARPRRKGPRATDPGAAGRRAGEPDGDPGSGGDDRGERGPGPADGPEPAPEVEAEEIALKRIYRRLARVLHPDLAPDEAEHARLSDLMAKVNAAYAKGDRTALEVMAERVGAGEPPGDLSDESRIAHLERRVAMLARIAASLARERGRLERCETARLRAEAEGRAAAGGDLIAETRAELGEEATAARADVLVRLDRAAQAAQAVARARRTAMSKIEKRGPTGARRAFDPLAESDLVRMGAARLDRRRATAAARELARALEDAARAAPWDVAISALAFFAEASGSRPPDVLRSAAAFAARWEALAAAWPGAPDLPTLLARLPRHLALGARVQGDEVLAGLQLATPDLGAGVRIALEREPVAAIARDALGALGPEEACAACGGRGPARHLHRTRGLDLLHGLVCPACGTVLRSYWRYGEVDGLEALAEHALRLGLVAEVTATLAGTALGFQLLPAEAEALTAERLRRRFAELYLAPYEAGIPADAIRIAGPNGPLAPAAAVAGVGRLRIVLAEGAETTELELLELLRARIERRFRP